MSKGHIIKAVKEGSIAEELELESGDLLYRINNKELKDIFDYHFMITDEFLTVTVIKKDGEEWELEIEKDTDEDLGIVFEEALMDQYQSCRNKCMFCFIDQMPPNMRDTLYFKDDDARLSFLQGNYITLTNMSQEDIDRIILYKLSPINISVHTTNPELRCKMLHNRFAGDVLKIMDQLFEAKINMNSQIVLCKGYNDGEELERSILELSSYLPYMRSLSVVPVGLTKYREGLVPLEKFSKLDSLRVLNIIHKWQNLFLEQYGTRFVYASDEWYLTAEQPIPEEENYEGYGQIENGVGIVRSFITEFEAYYDTLEADNRIRNISLVTGVLASPIINKSAQRLMDKFTNIKIHVYTIVNEFFGSDITVTGLLTGQDIINQLKGNDLGDYLVLPAVLLRSGEDVLLDDVTVSDLEIALQTKIHIVQSDGTSFINTIINN